MTQQLSDIDFAAHMSVRRGEVGLRKLSWMGETRLYAQGLNGQVRIGSAEVEDIDRAVRAVPLARIIDIAHDRDFTDNPSVWHLRIEYEAMRPLDFARVVMPEPPGLSGCQICAGVYIPVAEHCRVCGREGDVF